MLFVITILGVNNILIKQDCLVNFSGMKQNINLSRKYTVNDKCYTRENFRGFCRFLMNHESFPYQLILQSKMAIIIEAEL